MFEESLSYSLIEKKFRDAIRSALKNKPENHPYTKLSCYCTKGKKKKRGKEEWQGSKERRGDWRREKGSEGRRGEGDGREGKRREGDKGGKGGEGRVAEQKGRDRNDGTTEEKEANPVTRKFICRARPVL